MDTRRSRMRSLLILVPAGLVFVGALALVWSAGCAPNDPFDPESVVNLRPVVRMSVAPLEGNELSPTSYFNRRFSWFGNDQDGWVREYYVSIRTDAAVPAPWDTTANTDTTMTFATDDEGNAEATFYLVCRDDRGALSDTLVQFIPLRNFPPAVNYQSDFDPLRNMQRDFVMDGTTPVDTLYWNWGASNFRFFALDLDGAATMDDFFRYTMSATEPTETYELGDPLADPLTTWVRAPFDNVEEVREFELFVSGLPVGLATLTVSVSDEANADTRFTYSWDVRAPRSNILYVADNMSSIGLVTYTALMDDRFGAGNWDEYDFWFGFPDHPFVALASMRRFEAVLWTGGGVTSENLETAAARDGVLQSYVDPTDGAEPGRLLIVSSVLTGSLSGLPPVFTLGVLGVSPTGNPASALTMTAGRQALGQVAGLPAMTSIASAGRGIGLLPEAGTEILYRMEECLRCYSNRPPFDPIMAVRRPERTVEPLARVVGFSMQLEYFDQTEVLSALNAVLDNEMGVISP